VLWRFGPRAVNNGTESNPHVDDLTVLQLTSDALDHSRSDNAVNGIVDFGDRPSWSPEAQLVGLPRLRLKPLAAEPLGFLRDALKARVPPNLPFHHNFGRDNWQGIGTVAFYESK
jgi:hypothetical protein